jgi:hypothetical protein
MRNLKCLTGRSRVVPKLRGWWRKRLVLVIEVEVFDTNIRPPSFYVQAPVWREATIAEALQLAGKWAAVRVGDPFVRPAPPMAPPKKPDGPPNEVVRARP